MSYKLICSKSCKTNKTSSYLSETIGLSLAAFFLSCSAIASRAVCITSALETIQGITSASYAENLARWYFNRVIPPDILVPHKLHDIYMPDLPHQQPPHTPKMGPRLLAYLTFVVN